MMIDWVSGVINLKHKVIEAGRFISIDSDGSVEFESVKKRSFQGSYSTNFVCKSQGAVDDNGYSHELYFTGNPSKFLQGHNVFGSSDVKSLLFGVFSSEFINQHLKADLSQLSASIKKTKVTRIDVTDSLQFDNRNQVRAYINQLSAIAHTRNGRPAQKGWTLSFNPGSRRWKLKVYSKGDELDAHKLHRDFPHKDFIKQQADSLCRVELRLHSLELAENGINSVNELTQEKLAEIYAEYVGRVQMSEKLDITPEEIQALPWSLKATYNNWKGGIDLLASMKPSTYRRHRLQLREKVGIDISRPHQEAQVSNIVPLRQVVNARNYSIPLEAFNKDLVFQAKPALRAI